jgi:hypothetical protein
MRHRFLSMDVLEPRVFPSGSIPNIAIVFGNMPSATAMIKGMPVPASKRANIVAAINKQIQRDVAPIWGVSAVVHGYTNLSQVPAGDWVVNVSKYSFFAGVHYMTDSGVPAATVQYQGNWTAGLSHEVIEMLVDPSGSDFVWSKPSLPMVGYLKEVADPVEQRTYKIGGISVSDFITPSYYGGDLAVTSTRYDYLGAIHQPLELTRGGYYEYETIDVINGSAQVKQWQEAWFHTSQPESYLLSGTS